MKNKTCLCEQSILNLITQNNFLIPEIQRDYVWGNNEPVIGRFLNEIKNKAGNICSDCKMPKLPKTFNIGFLYSYKPEYVKVEYERFLDEYLIDGQQRFTTIFLLLFYSSLKENKKNDFLNLIRYEPLVRISFDYRVRDLTHRFLLEFIEKITTVDELNNIEEQTWFLKDYNNDVTIKSILQAIEIIQNKFGDDAKYYDYILNHVKFWHFKTEATSQGEELYITMNARGEGLADNEKTKAGLMINDDNLIKWGKKWEEWQDFFWKNREDNPNSDLGLNEFLRWIYLIEKCEKNKDDEENENNESVMKLKSYFQNSKTDTSELNFETIQKYFDSIDFLFTKDFKYIDKKWLAPSMSHAHPPLLLKSYVTLFPTIYYIKKIKDSVKTPNVEKLKRIIRYFFNLTRLSTVTNAPEIATISAIKAIKILLASGNDDIVELPTCTNQEKISKTILPKEERFKLNLYKNPPENESKEGLEKAFWEAEDFYLNNGKIEFVLKIIDYDISGSNKFDLELFLNYSKCYIKFFTNINNLLRRALLTKGDCWESLRSSYYGTRYTIDCKTLIAGHNNKFVIELIKVVHKIEKIYKEKNTNEILQEIITSYLESGEKKWYYSFIKYEQLLDYCKMQIIQRKEDSILILKRKIATSYKELRTACFYHEYLEGNKIHSLKPFTTSGYHEQQKWGNVCAVLDKWHYRDSIYAINIYFLDGKYKLRFWDKHDMPKNDKINYVLYKEGFEDSDNNNNYWKVSTDKEVDCKNALYSLCEKLRKVDLINVQILFESIDNELTEEYRFIDKDIFNESCGWIVPDANFGNKDAWFGRKLRKRLDILGNTETSIPIYFEYSAQWKTAYMGISLLRNGDLHTRYFEQIERLKNFVIRTFAPFEDHNNNWITGVYILAKNIDFKDQQAVINTKEIADKIENYITTVQGYWKEINV